MMMNPMFPGRMQPGMDQHGVQQFLGDASTRRDHPVPPPGPVMRKHH
jgi:hypothetical protein